MDTKALPLMNLEFIKLYKAMRAAQKDGLTSQKAQRRARSLEQICDAKIEAYERQVTESLKALEGGADS
jgi:hypothetical protein